MEIRRLIVGMVAMLWVLGHVAVTQADPFRISYFIWPGNGPFFVAQEKGLFAKEGIEVE